MPDETHRDIKPENETTPPPWITKATELYSAWMAYPNDHPKAADALAGLWSLHRSLTASPANPAPVEPREDRGEPPPGYEVRDIATDEDDVEHWDAYTVTNGEAALEGGWSTRDEAVARCWDHLDSATAPYRERAAKAIDDLSHRAELLMLDIKGAWATALGLDYVEVPEERELVAATAKARERAEAAESDRGVLEATIRHLRWEAHGHTKALAASREEATQERARKDAALARAVEATKALATAREEGRRAVAKRIGDGISRRMRINPRDTLGPSGLREVMAIVNETLAASPKAELEPPAAPLEPWPGGWQWFTTARDALAWLEAGTPNDGSVVEFRVGPDGHLCSRSTPPVAPATAAPHGAGPGVGQRHELVVAAKTYAQAIDEMSAGSIDETARGALEAFRRLENAARGYSAPSAPQAETPEPSPYTSPEHEDTVLQARLEVLRLVRETVRAGDLNRSPKSTGLDLAITALVRAARAQGHHEALAPTSAPQGGPDALGVSARQFLLCEAARTYARAYDDLDGTAEESEGELDDAWEALDAAARQWASPPHGEPDRDVENWRHWAFAHVGSRRRCSDLRDALDARLTGLAPVPPHGERPDLAPAREVSDADVAAALERLKAARIAATPEWVRTCMERGWWVGLYPELNPDPAPAYVPKVGDPVEWTERGTVTRVHATAQEPWALVDTGPGNEKVGVSFARLRPTSVESATDAAADSPGPAKP